MQPVKGFMSDDGNFFYSEIEAELHEAESVLLGELSAREIAAERFMSLVVDLDTQVRRYLDAYQKAKPFNSKDNQDDGGASEKASALQQQSPSGRGNVPDLGSGSPAEEI